MGGGDTSPSRRRLLEKQKPEAIVPEIGAAKYWYVDPRAQDQPHEDQGDALLDALRRMLETGQQYQPAAQQGQLQF